MAGEWHTVALAEAPVEIIDGDRGRNYPKQQEFLESGHCLFLNAGNVTTDGFNFSSCVFISSDRDQRLRKGKLARHDVVLTTRGTIGNSAYFDESVPYEHIRINSGMVILRAFKPELHSRYLYLVIRSKLFVAQIQALRTGSAQPQLPIRDLEKISIPLPPIPEQCAISHILGTLDDRIELNRRMNQTLEEMARAMFKSWFVDFDPVHAKATLKHHAATLPQGGSHWSIERARAYLDRMDPDITALFPDGFVDSECGPIPRGWKVNALGDYLVNFDSKRIPVSKAKRANRPGIFPYYGAAGLMDYIDDYIFDGTYLLIGEDGSVVKPNDLAVTQYVWGKLWVNNHAHVLQGRGSVSAEQLYLYFNFEPIAPFVTGAVQPKVSQGRMNMMPFVFAGDEVCRAFATVVDPWFAKLRSVTDTNKILKALRDTLLPKLISGELQVDKSKLVHEEVE